MDTFRKGYEMNNSITLTPDIALAILAGLSAEGIRLTDTLETVERFAPEQAGFWQTRIDRNREATRLVMTTRWTEEF